MNQLATIEHQRLTALSSCKIMDTSREPMFDRLVFTAAQLFRVPMALITLVDEHRSWAKAKVGPLPTQRAKETSVSNLVISTNAPVVAEDALLDPRFVEGLTICDGRPIRFLASVPVYGPGKLPIGALTVCCTEARMGTERRLSNLHEMANEVGELLCLRVPNLDVITG